MYSLLYILLQILLYKLNNTICIIHLLPIQFKHYHKFMLHKFHSNNIFISRPYPKYINFLISDPYNPIHSKCIQLNSQCNWISMPDISHLYPKWQAILNIHLHHCIWHYPNNNIFLANSLNNWTAYCMSYKLLFEHI